MLIYEGNDSDMIGILYDLVIPEGAKVVKHQLVAGFFETINYKFNDVIIESYIGYDKELPDKVIISSDKESDDVRNLVSLFN